MTYATLANVRALTGLSTSDISDDDVNVLIGISDIQVDNEKGVTLTAAQKGLLSDYFTSALAFASTSGTLSVNTLIELKGAIKLDVKSSTALKTGLSKKYFDYYERMLSQLSSDDLVERVET